MRILPPALRSPRATLSGVLACGLFALLSPAHGFVVDTAANVVGLPPGLTVHYAATPQCGPRPTGTAGGDMAETNATSFEAVRDPLTGQVRLRPVIVTRYAAAPFRVQTAAGCDLGANVEHTLTVRGERDNGSAVVRQALLGHSIAQDTFNRTIDVTPEVTALPAASELPRNQTLRLTTSFKNLFGHANTSLPTLEFRRPTTTLMQGVSIDQVTRVFIDRNDQRCISAPAPLGLRCAARARGAVLEHAGIRLMLGDSTQFGPTSRTQAQLQLELTLTSAFPAGTYTLRAHATDDDPFDYLVDGQPRAISLFNWRPASKSVLVQ